MAQWAAQNASYCGQKNANFNLFHPNLASQIPALALIDPYVHSPHQVPIYFSMGLTEKANNYYKMFITWTNEKIRKTFVERNMFDFKHIKGFDRR